MSDGEFGPTYAQIRQVSNLSTTEISDAVLDDHIEESLTEIQKANHITFSTAQPTLTDEVFNSRDIFYNEYKYIMYLNRFGNYSRVVTITSVETRSDDTDSYTTLTEGEKEDYVFDLKANAFHFFGKSRLTSFGNKNIRLNLTYGYTIANMPLKYKKLIALLAAKKALIYASGSVFNETKNVSIGGYSESIGEPKTNYAETLTRIDAMIQDHCKATGLSIVKTQILFA